MTLQVSKLSKRQGNHWLFRDVEFDVASGETFGIFGPNNSGKREILDLIAGTEKPNGGSITVSGAESSGGNVHFYHSENAGSVVSRLFGKRPENSPIVSSDLSAFLSETQAGFLLFDEPFRDLDRLEREKIGAIFREARDAGRSVIFTSSNFDDMLEFADRVCVMTAGYVEQTAPPQEIYDEPSSVAVAAVVGRSNLIAARRLTSSKSDTPEYITINGEHRLFTRRTAKASLGALNQNISLMIRPEQISISFGASFPEDNLLKATVSAVTPMGATTRVELDCDGLHLEALVLRLVGLNVGEECMVGLPPDRIIVLRA
jgi:ABC-type sulfate/molybdate transport systems ATPase subunit